MEIVELNEQNFDELLESTVLDISKVEDINWMRNVLVDSRIRSVKIDGNRLKTKNFPEQELLLALFEILERSPLQEVMFSNLDFYPNQLQDLCSLLHPSQTRVKWNKLTLYNCGIDQFAFQKICENFSGNAFLRELDISNNCIGDEGMMYLKISLTGFDNKITSVFLSHNGISDKGVDELCEILKNQKCVLESIWMVNNPLVTSFSLTKIFRILSYTGYLNTLNLSGCSIVDCSWSRYLPFVKTLTNLMLSENEIDDNNILKLLSNLVHCFSVSSLDLSHNCFGREQRTRTAWKELFVQNQSIQYLNLSKNVFERTILKAISDGLNENSVVLSISLLECLLVKDDIKLLASCFGKNDTVRFELDLNPIPLDLIRDCREYFRNQSETGAHGSFIAENPLRERCSVIAATAWRNQKRDQIRVALEAIGILENPSNTTQYNPWNLENIEKSEFYKSVEEMDRSINDHNLLETHGTKDICIALGREAYEIGTISIKLRTTYGEARKLIEPLVLEECKNMAHDELNDFLSFSILTSNDQIISKDDSNIRTVWSDVYKLPRPVLIVKPASWISLQS